VPLSLAGAGALAVNWVCAAMLSRHRHHGSSLVLAAFLSARNDVIANLAIIAAGLLTAYSQSGWPDLMVGLAIAAINIGATREVYLAATGESDNNSPTLAP
jgi:Co/Zn/Cd efflux system component